MTREIKFRAKSKDHAKGWVYYTLPRTNDNPNIEILAAQLFAGVVDFATLAQFTGLKDKNGKDIYEGDIIKYHDSIAFEDDDPDGNMMLVVMWSDQTLSWRTFQDELCDIEMPEVIGNIYENPELREAKA